MSDEIIDVNDVLERVQDDRELFLELLDIFNEDFAQKRKSLSDFIEKSDFQEIKDIIHSIKGASGNISAKAMHASCSEIEKLAEKQDINKLSEVIEKLDDQFAELQARIKEIKEEFAH